MLYTRPFAKAPTATAEVATSRWVICSIVSASVDSAIPLATRPRPLGSPRGPCQAAVWHRCWFR